jgi:hypothetical protein
MPQGAARSLVSAAASVAKQNKGILSLEFNAFHALQATDLAPDHILEVGSLSLGTNPMQ